MTVRVAANGYGVIGKRVADTVRVVPDIEPVGVADEATAGGSRPRRLAAPRPDPDTHRDNAERP